MNALRWWNNISSYKSEFASLPAGAAAAAAAAEEEDDDDVDLFGSDDEEDAEAERIKVKSKLSLFLERILMEHIKSICSLESHLFFVSICSIKIPSRNGDIFDLP